MVVQAAFEIAVAVLLFVIIYYWIVRPLSRRYGAPEQPAAPPRDTPDTVRRKLQQLEEKKAELKRLQQEVGVVQQLNDLDAKIGELKTELKDLESREGTPRSREIV